MTSVASYGKKRLKAMGSLIQLWCMPSSGLRLRKASLWGVLLCTTFVPIIAQQIEIEGYVLDRERKPIEFAYVRILGKAIGTSTNLRGYYKFRMAATTDSVEIVYSCLGYKSVSRKFGSLTQNIKLNVELSASSIELGGVVVKATDSKRTNTMQRISTEAIKASVSPAGSVESLVGTYAGVSQNNELSSQYSVRGGSYDENLVYVNGIEIYRPLLIRSAEQEGLSFVNPDLTNSVQFSAGGFTADYGDKISSVLDIRYDRPESNRGSVSIGLMGSSAYYGSRYGRFSQITGIRYKSGRSLLNSLNNTDAEYDPHYFDAQTFLTYSFSPKFRIDFLGNLSLTAYRFKPISRLTNFGTQLEGKQLKVYFNGQEKDRFLSSFGAIALHYTPSERWRHTLTLSAFNSRESESYDIASEYILNADEPGAEMPTGGNALGLGYNHEHARNHLYSTVANFVYRADFIASEVHRWQIGLDIKHEQIRDHISEWEKRDSLGYSLPRDPQLLHVYRNLYSDVSLSSVRVSAYIQDRISIDLNNGRLSFIPGLRASWWSFNKKATFSPRMTLSFAPEAHKSLVYRLSGGLYYQAPFYKELRGVRADANANKTVILNKDIKSQGAAVLLVGGDYDFLMGDSKFKFTAEAYYKYLFDINPYIRENVKVRYLGQNAGTGYIYGIDLKLFGEFVPGVDSWLTCSLLKSQQRIRGIGDMPLMNAPAYNVSLFFQDYFPGYKRISLSLRGAISGALPELNPARGFSTPAFTGSAYKRVDIGMQYVILQADDAFALRHPWLGSFRSISLGIDAFNLFDISNINSYYWVSDVYNRQYAVPNYLTRRQWNLRLTVDF